MYMHVKECTGVYSRLQQSTVEYRTVDEGTAVYSTVQYSTVD